MPDNQIHCLAESDEGILWIGTQAGLVGYDGTGFRALEEAEAVAHAPILAVLVDRKKQLWISTVRSLHAHGDRALDLVLDGARVTRNGSILL